MLFSTATVERLFSTFKVIENEERTKLGSPVNDLIEVKVLLWVTFLLTSVVVRLLFWIESKSETSQGIPKTL